MNNTVVNATYKGSKGTLSLLENRVHYLTPDGKQVSLSFASISECTPTAQGVALTCPVAGKKARIRSFGIQGTSIQKSAWISALKEKLEPDSSQAEVKPKSEPVAQNISSKLGSTPSRAPQTLAEKRAYLLLSDTYLKDLYDILVVKGVLSAEEFWSSRPEACEALDNMYRSAVAAESVGVSNRLSEFEGIDEGDELCIEMTFNMIHDIFVQNPYVKRAYDENVPGKMSEREFWEDYWRAQYLNRSVGKTEDGKRSARFFQRYKDELSASRHGSGDVSRIDPSVNLLVEEGDGNISDGEMAVSETVKGSKEIIERMSKHASYILNSIKPVSEQVQGKAYQEKLAESLRLDELDDTSLANDHSYRELSVDRVEEKCLDAEEWEKGLVQVGDQLGRALVGDEILLWGGAIDYMTKVSLGMQAHYKARVINEKKSGVVRGRGEDLYMFGVDGQDVRIDRGLCRKISKQLSKGQELLRHFWSCIPVQSEETRVKLTKMGKALSEYHAEIVEKRTKLQNIPEYSSMSRLFDVKAVERALVVFQSIDSKSGSKRQRV